jgi:hypothetical protein
LYWLYFQFLPNIFVLNPVLLVKNFRLCILQIIQCRTSELCLVVMSPKIIRPVFKEVPYQTFVRICHLPRDATEIWAFLMRAL